MIHSSIPGQILLMGEHKSWWSHKTLQVPPPSFPLLAASNLNLKSWYLSFNHSHPPRPCCDVITIGVYCAGNRTREMLVCETGELCHVYVHYLRYLNKMYMSIPKVDHVTMVGHHEQTWYSPPVFSGHAPWSYFLWSCLLQSTNWLGVVVGVISSQDGLF